MKKLLKRKYVWTVIYSVLLISFTVYISMDTFVIARVYSAVPYEFTENNDRSYSSADTVISSHQTEVTENSYSDENISITVTEYREYDTSVYVADITVSSSEYLRTALAQNSYGKNVTEKTSVIASNNNAILAINGDYYGSRQSGYVIRNGTLFRTAAANGEDDLVIYSDGSFGIISEDEISAEQLIDSGAEQVLSFGPVLINEGNITVSSSEEVDKSMTSNPRTAVGIIDNLHYVFVVSDGRTSESEGLTLYQLAGFMRGLGVQIAYNLDGGGSSAMYFNGSLVNNPTTNGKTISERSVSDIVYIGY